MKPDALSPRANVLRFSRPEPAKCLKIRNFALRPVR
jgi:hypothetical protein